jgi:hypothetical protein
MHEYRVNGRASAFACIVQRESIHGLELALGSCDERQITTISSSERSGAMKERRFSSGDRVKTCETIRDLPVGAYGVIKRVYASMPGTYDVQFDHRADIYTVWGGHLEPAFEESKAISSPPKPRGNHRPE